MLHTFFFALYSMSRNTHFIFMENETWFILNAKGEQIGPLTPEQLSSIAIERDTPVRKREMDSWNSASSFPELSSILDSIPPPYIPDNQEAPKKEAKVKEDITEIDNRKMFKGMLFFKGRARRLEYCLVLLILFIIFFGLTLLFESVDVPEVFINITSTVYAFFAIWILLSERARRCHDLGLAGFYQFIPIIFFWLAFQDGEHWTNQWGNNPKGYQELKPLGKL